MDPIPVDAPAAKPTAPKPATATPAATPAAPKPPALGLLAALPLNKRQLVGAGVAALSLCAGVGVVKFWSPAPEASQEKHDAPVLARGATPKSDPIPPIVPQQQGTAQSPPLNPPGALNPPLPNPDTRAALAQPGVDTRWFYAQVSGLLDPIGRYSARGSFLDSRCCWKADAWALPRVPYADLATAGQVAPWQNPALAYAPTTPPALPPVGPGIAPAAPAAFPPVVSVAPQVPLQYAGGPQVPLTPPGVTPIQATVPQAPAVTPPLPMVPAGGPNPPAGLPPPTVVPDAKNVSPALPLLPAGPAKVELPAVSPVPPAVTPVPPAAPLPNSLVTPPTPASVVPPPTPAVASPMTPAVTPPIPGAPVGPRVLPETQPLTPPALTPPALTPPALTPPTVVPTPPAVNPAAPPALTPTPPAVTPMPPAITPTPPGPAALPPVTPVGGARTPEPTVTRTPQTSFDVDLHDPKAGETYEAISKSFYNDARYARALAAFNNNRPLQGGAMIEVPPVHVLRNRFGQQVGMATTPVPAPAEPAFRTAGRRFVVPAGGMSLPAVARQTLGSEARWRDIYDLNPQVAPGMVPAGTELRLPPDATGP